MFGAYTLNMTKISVMLSYAVAKNLKTQKLKTKNLDVSLTLNMTKKKPISITMEMFNMTKEKGSKLMATYKPYGLKNLAALGRK